MIDRRLFAKVTGASALVLASVMAHEHLVTVANIPVPNDPPTYAFGSTRRPDGSPVQVGDKISRKGAVYLLNKQMTEDYIKPLQKCGGDLELSEGEEAAMLDLAWNIGAEKVCSSTMVKKFRAKDYDGGCKAVYLFDRLHGRKCSLPQNRNRKDGCKGIMNRRDEQYKLCMRGK